MVTLSGVPQVAHAQQVVAPNSLAATEGDTNSQWPFYSSFGGGQRMQQVYNASEFAGIGPGKQITQIAFRQDKDFAHPLSRTLSDVTIRLSTTARAADAIDGSSFASNVGADVTTVRSGILTFSSTGTGPVGGPKDFDVVINLTTPFVYNPAAGNLLLDILNASPETNFDIVFFDGGDARGDSVSTIFSEQGAPFNPAGNAFSFGYVTRFTFVPVTASAAPEPASLTLLALAGLPVVGAITRRNPVSIRRRRPTV